MIRMSSFNEQLLLQLLQTCANAEPQPLYPARFAREANIERGALDRCLDELRRRGLVKLTEWVREFGQGCELTDAGRHALAVKKLTSKAPAAPETSTSAPGAYDRGEIVRDSVFYPAKPVVGRFLLAINIAYFLLGALYAGYHDLSVGDYLAGRDGDENRTTTKVLDDLGGLIPSRIVNRGVGEAVGRRPEFERILLASFLHAGLLHLGMNMYFLATIGSIIESMWDRWRFLAIYLLAGIISGCIVLLLLIGQQRNALTIGASGSMFGLFASLVVWFTLNYQYLPPQVIDAFKRNLGVNLVLLVAINFVPGVSWQGHLGGAIGGAIVALLLNAERFHPSAAVRWLALAAVPVVPVAFFVGVLWMSGWL